MTTQRTDPGTIQRQGRLTAGLGRGLGVGVRVAGVAAALVLVMLGAMIAGVFAIALTALGCLRPTATRRQGHGRAPGIGAVDSVQMAEVRIAQGALTQPRA